MRCASWWGVLLVGCANRAPLAYLATEASFLRVGVDLDAEEREVRRVLGQRRLEVVSELRTHDFRALGAESPDGTSSAVRIVTRRGVVIAEDGEQDDLFAPGRVTLVEGFAPRLGDLSLVAVLRTARSADAGCISLRRIAPDGVAHDVTLDVSEFGGRACVTSLAHGARGRIAAGVGFPTWSAGVTPMMQVELAFATVPLGRAEPLVRLARPVRQSPVLDSERKRLSEASCTVDFAHRHALGVARAALAHFLGESRNQVRAAYEGCVGAPSDSDELGIRTDAVDHIARGFSDAVPTDAAPTPPPTVDAEQETIIEPDGGPQVD